MNEFSRKFDTIRFVAPLSIFMNFFRIFHFLNLNLNFKFGPVWYRFKPKPGRIGLTGNRSNRTGSHRFDMVMRFTPSHVTGLIQLELYRWKESQRLILFFLLPFFFIVFYKYINMHISSSLLIFLLFAASWTHRYDII